MKAADDSLDIAYSGDTAAWHNFVTRINNSLNDLHLELRHADDELTGRKMYALVSSQIGPRSL